MKLPPCCVMEISAVSVPVSTLYSAPAISRQREPKEKSLTRWFWLLSLERPHPLYTGCYAVPLTLKNRQHPSNAMHSPTQARGNPPCICEQSSQQSEQNAPEKLVPGY